MMIRLFVLDTNNIISAHLLPRSINRKVFDKALEKGIICCSNETFLEFKDVFTRSKFDKYLSLDKRLNAIEFFEQTAQFVEVKTNVQVCRDPKDDKFLSLALSAQVDCLVTGDKDLLVLNPFRQIPILSPADFLHKF